VAGVKGRKSQIGQNRPVIDVSYAEVQRGGSGPLRPPELT
jgi:hypothetical protein